MDEVEQTETFEQERPRLVNLARRILGDHGEAEDVVQQTWLRLHGTEEKGQDVENLPAWLTTVTTRLCLDRLKARTPVPTDELEPSDRSDSAPDPVEDVVLADTVGIALQVVLDRLSPQERVAFVLHDTFGFEFPTIASLLDTTPVAARKLASRARAKVSQPAAEDRLADWEVVDAFLEAAREGEFARLVELLAPDAFVGADEAAVLMGTPQRIEGREAVATFFNGAAKTAFPAYVEERPGAAWLDRGVFKVAFDFTVVEGRVTAITFRADPELLTAVVRRDGAVPRS